METFKDEIIRIIQLYLLGECTAQKKEKLEDWCRQSEKNRRFLNTILKNNTVAEEFLLYAKVDEKRALKKFESRVRKYSGIYNQIGRYAAVLFLLIGIAYVWQFKRTTEIDRPIVDRAVTIVPGESKAVLVLSDGKRISLEQHKTGEISEKDQVKVVHETDRLVYPSAIPGTREEEVYNTLEIPRRGEYELILADGTRVYLNSASTLRYPVAFSCRERKVYLNGEAYFEVAKEAGRPFLVEAEGTEIRVYGTSFNVNTFNQVSVVLEEGSIGVKLLKTGQEKRISPGQLAKVHVQDGIRVEEVNTALYTAWKDGFFHFENLRLEKIMTILSRWYDVNVFYQSSAVKELHFSGFMERYKEIGIILEAINEATGVKFLIQGKTIIVSE